MKLHSIIITLITIICFQNLAVSQTCKCLKKEKIEKSFDSFMRNISNEGRRIYYIGGDSLTFNYLYSINTFNEISTPLLNNFPSVNCDSLKNINVVMYYHAEHFEKFLYYILQTENEYHYYFVQGSKSIQKIGSSDEVDYLSYIADKLFHMGSPLGNDHLVMASFKDSQLVDFIITKRVNLLDHFQIIAVVEKLLMR